MTRPGIQAEEPVFTFTLDDFLNNKEFVENEIVLTVQGRGANRTTYTHVEEIVRKTAKLSKEEKVEEQFSCYRLEIPTRWYIRCKKEDLVEKLNNQSTKGKVTAEGSKLTFRFQKKSEEVTRVRLLWVPPNLQLGAIKRLAETVFGPEVTVTRPEERRDLSRIDHGVSQGTTAEVLPLPFNRTLAKSVFQQDEPEDGEDSGEESGASPREYGDWHLVCQDGWYKENSPSDSTTTSNKNSPRRDNSKSSPRRCSNKTGNREGLPS